MRRDENCAFVFYGVVTIPFIGHRSILTLII